MSEENKNKGPRCNECNYCTTQECVGKASTSQLLKSRWSTEGKGKSLKEYARALAKAGDELAQEWLDHKKGLLNPDRSEANLSRIRLEKLASKAARTKKKA